MPQLVRSVLPCLALLAALPLAAAEYQVERTSEGATVKLDGKLVTNYIKLSGNKPILWPLAGPQGKHLTRSFPMTRPKEHEKADHPHHRSFWFDHGDVNGISFWHQGDDTGVIEHQDFVELSGGKSATIVTRNDWIGPGGEKQCEDVRRFTFGHDDSARWIDVEVTVLASEGPVTFGDTKEGSFGVRVAGTMKVDSKLGGTIVNSHGDQDKAAWGKPAPWVDYHGPVDGGTAGIAILNHPSSFRYPTYWHVRTYGLFAANPFGVSAFENDRSKNGALTLEKGEQFTLRYRVLLHSGDEKAGRVAEHFQKYSQIEY